MNAKSVLELLLGYQITRKDLIHASCNAICDVGLIAVSLTDLSNSWS